MRAGWLAIVGLGPGSADLVTPEVTRSLAEATDLVGYGPYVARVPERPGLTRHASDNRVELDRARHALMLTDQGRKVAIVSSGDPGVFAMAAALFEAVEQGEPHWRDLDIRILPGISAMHAAAARLGAPLGHDFCAINLSDNLKPWSLVERRLRLAAEADFVIALYNPHSKARDWQLAAAFDVLRRVHRPDTPVMLATAISDPAERIEIVALSEASPERVTMRTVVIVGSSQTRIIPHGKGRYVYTPRSVAEA